MSSSESKEQKEPTHPASGQTSSSSSPPAGQLPPLPLAGPSLFELVATLGHEFRTPLTVIEGYTSTLLSRRARLAPEEQDEFLQMIQQAGRRLGKLTEQLLDIAQLQAGIINLSLDPVDLSLLAREAIKEAEQQVPESLRSHFTLALECRDALGHPVQGLPTVKGDARRLYQVLLHLLENAIRYSPTGGRIDVIARPVPQAEGQHRQEALHDPSSCAELCVCDLGVGIANEHLERIFDPFYRVESGLTRESNGLGLGLTICKHLVTLHQGQIWAESCPEGGSAFHVWFPFAEPVSAC